MIALKNIFLKNHIVFFFLLFFLNKGVLAHELWLEKNSNVEDKTLIDIMIGQNFKGTPFGFSNDEKEKLFLDNNNITKDIEQRDGNFPAIQIKLNNNYFNVINYESKYSFLEYDDIKTFEDFVKEQNFLDILLSYKPNKLPTENYKRFSKILISNSDDFFQQQSKLNFEFIALNSPFDKRNEFFEFRLMDKGKPLGNFQVTIFSKTEENFIKEIIETKPNGEGKIRVFDDRVYLLSAVKIFKPNFIQNLKSKSDWISHWASMTF
jgi:uncharacterized GH25 family protein